VSVPVCLRHSRDAPDPRDRMTLGMVCKKGPRQASFSFPGESLPFAAKSLVERDDVS
jgi:cobalamin biosynthesis protein CobT